MNTTRAHQLAAQIATFETDRLQSLMTMQLEPEVSVGYQKLYDLVCQENKKQFEEIVETDHDSLRRDFAAEAGYLIGLEVGKRLGGCAMTNRASIDSSKP